MLAWSLTYLVHSTLLIGAVWLISRRLADRPLALDRLWKLALVGGVVTASVQTAAGLSPAHLQLGTSHGAAAVAAHKPVEVRWHFDFPKASENVNRTPEAGDRKPEETNGSEMTPPSANGRRVQGAGLYRASGNSTFPASGFLVPASG